MRGATLKHRRSAKEMKRDQEDHFADLAVDQHIIICHFQNNK